jgi:guanylate kinase
MHQGKVLIFSAPSGSGKTTIVQHLLKQYPSLGFSISATTRPPRDSEAHGKDYYFITTQEFQHHIQKQNLIEWEEVYPGRFYGTLASEVQRLWDEGRHVVFDVDVVGGINLKNYFKERALSVFVRVGSLQDLKDRLSKRNSDCHESITVRLMKAEEEYNYADRFDLILNNDSLADALAQAEKLVSDFIDKSIENPSLKQ